MPTHPVVFVPGFPASELVLSGGGRVLFPPALGDLVDAQKRARLIDWLSGAIPPPSPIVAGEPIRDIVGIFKEAQSLYDRLREYGYAVSSANAFFQPVGWDWRGAVDAPTVQSDLANAITGLAAANGPVIVIAHSTGGLVLRSLLAARPGLAASIRHVMAFGVPWAGTLKALRNLDRGAAIGFPALGLGLTATEVRRVMRNCQAAYDLLPPGPPATDLRGADGKPLDLVVRVAANGTTRTQIAPCVDTAWMPQGPTGDPMRAAAAAAAARLGTRASAWDPAGALPPLTNVAGWGMGTDVCCVLEDDGTLAVANQWNPSAEGDGTVPFESASWIRGPGTRTLCLPIGVYPTAGLPTPHDDLWSAPPVLDVLDHVLKDVPAEPWVCGSVDHDDAIDTAAHVTIRLAVSTADGRPLPGAKAKIAGTTPSSFPFGNAVRQEILLDRGNLQPNAGADLHRLVVRVEWTGGTRELPVVFRV